MTCCWPSSHCAYCAVSQADPGAGNPSGLLLLLRLREAQRGNRGLPLGQVSQETRPLPGVFVCVCGGAGLEKLKDRSGGASWI